MVLLKSGPDKADLERVKTSIRAARIYARDSAQGRAYDYGQGLATGLSIEDVNDWPDILSAVTAQDVMAAAQEVLTGDARVTGWLLPAPPAETAANSSAAAVPGDAAAPPAAATAETQKEIEG